MKDLREYLELANVPVELHEQALESLNKAKAANSGLLWHKIIARYIKAGKLAKIVVEHKVTRPSNVDPSLAKYDVARAKNINAFGDNADWGPDGPIDENVYDFAVGSPEYEKAIKRNYWKRGVFPGEYEAVKAWYVRNGGEQEACTRGVVVDTIIKPETVQRWRNAGVTVYKLNDAWQIITEDKFLKFIKVNVRIGYEVDNLYDFDEKVQSRFALDGEPLYAPVSWTVLP